MVRASPTARGITRLSLNGVGSASAIVPVRAAIIALVGGWKMLAARSEAVNPAMVPSTVFPLEYGSLCLPSRMPVSDAVLSPIARTDMAALAVWVG